MKKHTTQFKQSVAEQYLNGLDGYKELGRQHGVAYSLVKRWVAYYRYHGLDGLARRTSKSPCTPEFKLSALRYMWENKLSYAEASARFNIRGQCHLGMWERSYREGGIEALMSPVHQKDQPMPVPEANSSPSTAPADDARPREELLKELNYLRMENAYLKKLKALVQSQQQAAASRSKRK